MKHSNYNDTWIFDVVNEEWSIQNRTGTDFPEKRHSHSACFTGSSQIIQFGGYNSGFLSDTWNYNKIN